MKKRGPPTTAPWPTDYRTVAHRLPHRGPPTTAPWPTDYRTVAHRHIFFFYKNQKLIARFCPVKDYKSYIKEKTRAKPTCG